MAEELLDYDEDEDDVMVPGAAPAAAVTAAPARLAAQHASQHSAGFKDFMLKPELLRAINEAGYEHPSEVQEKCIPQAVLGMDVLCQAKSGMGKTAVFVISTLQEIEPSNDGPSILVLTPTRELAFQIATQYKLFKKHMPGIRMGVFFGGLPVERDIENLKKGVTHIIVGTPGRILGLISERVLDLSNIKHFILDECDKMLQKLDMRGDVQKIFLTTPKEKQVMMFSATLSSDIQPICRAYLNSPMEVIVDDQAKLTLERLMQYYLKVPEESKNTTLQTLLDLLEFHQVIIFTNTVHRCGVLGQMLNEGSFPVITINSAMTQDERLARYHQFKIFEKRVLVATDLFGRGMDIERVNVVINYDCPQDTDTYLHRIARAGRFGSKGLAVTFSSSEDDAKILMNVQDRFDTNIPDLPDEIDFGLYMRKEQDSSTDGSSPETASE